MPAMLGGKPDKGTRMLDKALKIGKREALISQLLYAQYCTPAVQDKNLFTKLMKEIRFAKADANKDLVLINNSVKEKEPYVRKLVGQLFIDEEDED
jgi:hypothetical protein